MQFAISAIKLARPVHWVKNLALFAALVFSGELFTEGLLQTVIWAFISFCFVSSATYIINDIKDAKRDRLHPIKKNRPVASGAIPVHIAVFEALVFLALSLFIAVNLDSFLFTASVFAYFILQLLYSFFLKNLAIIDILIIASGFIIRVYAGAFVVDVHLSVWFLLCVISTALFLASGKRRAEYNIVGNTKGVTRKSLLKYDGDLLSSYVTMFGSATWLSWALFTFFESPPAPLPVWLFLAELSRTTTINKLVSSVALWVILIVWIIYGGAATVGFFNLT
jgi:4-hydroxybenzoate polyprenyltransferase